MTTAVKAEARHSSRAVALDWMETTTPDEFIRRSEEYFVHMRDFYDRRARWNRHFYRMSGILVIVLGGGLPILAGSDIARKDLIIAVIGFVVASITALRGFYRWDSAWVLMRETEFMLTKRYVAWKAIQMRSPEFALLREETAKLLNDLVAIRENEARAFFKDLPVPPGENQAKAQQ